MDGIGPISDLGFQIADSARVANLPSALTPPPSDVVDRSDEKKQQVAKDFESVLLTRLFNQVQQTIGHWDPDEDGTAQQVQGLFWLYLARDAADKGGLGLWKEIYQNLQQMEGTPNPVEALDEEF